MVPGSFRADYNGVAEKKDFLAGLAMEQYPIPTLELYSPHFIYHGGLPDDLDHRLGWILQ